MIILQISPEFAPGTGVGGVAWALEQQWKEQGHDVRRFGPKEAGCGFLAAPAPGLRGRLRHAGRVLWFSTVGTVRARRAVSSLPAGAVSICHNDALAGDVYVNHGVLTSAMRARGYFAWRMVRNPLHLFTTARDIYRYRAGTHRAVVNLSEADQATVVHRYRLAPARAWVIPNGVHLDRFVPPTEVERKAARAAHGIPGKARVAAFVGHEFERKGLPLLLEAASELADHHVIVVGGTAQQVDAQRAALNGDLAGRVHWVGRVPDPRSALAAADVLVLPSAYEANPLVVLEALATGLQVVSTPVGSNPQTLVDPMVCRIVNRSSGAVRAGLEELAAVPLPRAEIVARARELAARSSWPLVAARYLDLFSELVEREGA